MTSQVIGIVDLRAMMGASTNGDPVQQTQPAPTIDRSQTLRTALRANVALSTFSGLTLLLGAPWLDDTLGVVWPVLVGLGAGLLGFARIVLAVSHLGDGLEGAAKQVIAADLLWVAGAVPLIVSDLLTGSGDVAVAVVSVGVALVAAAQIAGVRRLADQPD